MTVRVKSHFSCLSNNADSCQLKISVSTQILKPNKFVCNVHETGGVFDHVDNPPTPDKVGPLGTNLFCFVPGGSLKLVFCTIPPLVLPVHRSIKAYTFLLRGLFPNESKSATYSFILPLKQTLFCFKCQCFGCANTTLHTLVDETVEEDITIQGPVSNKQVKPVC